MRVIPTSFLVLFTRRLPSDDDPPANDPFANPKSLNIDRIDVPLFQRKFCWQDNHLTALLNDAKSPKGGEHHLGRLTFIDFKRYQRQKSFSKRVQGSTNGRHLLCVDGQQRITSTMILLSAIRDLLFLMAKRLRSFLECFTSEDPAAISVMFNKTVKLMNKADDISSLLFTDSTLHTSYRTKSLGTTNYNHQRGEVLNGALFIPTHDDRIAFFNVLLGNVPAEITLQSPEAQALLRSRISRAKLIFNTALQNPAYGFLSKELCSWLQGELNLNSLAAVDELYVSSCSRIQSLLTNVLNKLKVIFIELDECNDAQASFQTMFVVGKVNAIRFKIPRPGIDLSESDQIRNFLLGFFAHEMEDEGDERDDKSSSPIEKQSTIYFNYWLPIEESFPDPESLDIFFDWYLGEFETDEDAKALRKEQQALRKQQFESMSLGGKFAAFIMKTNPSLFFEYEKYVQSKVLKWHPEKIKAKGAPAVSEGKGKKSEEVVNAEEVAREANLILDELKQIRVKSQEYIHKELYRQ